jgi:hypothetical protein
MQKSRYSVGAIITALFVTVPSVSAAAICNKYCDGRDPALSPMDRQPVTATIYSRSIALHFDDTDAMSWASIDNGSPGDEVWLDRSFDGGRTWASGSKLGATKIPASSKGWRTLMYNVDDWAAKGVGAMRACGKAGDRPEIACTPWARTTWNAYDRRTAAATALMQFYDYNTGLFSTTGWWNSANATGDDGHERLRVLGRGVVTIFDGRNVVSNAHEARRTAPLLASGVVLHVLPAGSVFDLTDRSLVRQDPVVDPSEAEELAVAGRDLKRLARDIAAGDVSPTVLRRRRARQHSEGDLPSD